MFFGALVLLLAMGIGILFYAERGTQYAFSLLDTLTHGTVQAQGVSGRLSGPLRLDTLEIKLENQTVLLTDIRLDWRPAALLGGKLKIASLHVDKLALSSKIDQTKTASTGLPDSIDLPLRLQIDQIRIERGSIARGPVELLSLGTLVFGLDYDGKRYALDLDRFSASKASGSSTFATALSGTLNLSTRKPYALNATVVGDSASGPADNAIGARGRISLRGSLAEIAATVNLRVAQAAIEGQAIVRPFSQRMLGATRVAGTDVNLAQINADWPQTALDIHLEALENGNGTVRISNAEAGLYNDHRLPLKKLAIDFSQSEVQSEMQFSLSKIAIALGTMRHAAGSIDGNGTYTSQGITLRLQTAKLDLQQLDSRMRATKLAGKAELRTEEGKHLVTLSLAEPLSKNTLKFDAHAVIADTAVAIDRIALRAGASALDANAHMTLNGSKDFAAKGTVRNFHLRDFGNFSGLPKLQLNGDFSVQGKRQPGLQADAVFHINDSTLDKHPLTGAGEIQLRANSLTIQKLDLTAGANHLNAQGKLAGPDSQLVFAIDAPNLAQIGAAFAGALRLNGKASGDLKKLHIVTDWRAKGLRAPNRWRLDATQGHADLVLQPEAPIPVSRAELNASANGLQAGTRQVEKLQARVSFSLAPNAPLSIVVTADELNAGTSAADTLSLDIRGTTAQHVLHAALQNSEQKWNFAASGGLQAQKTGLRWAGTIDAVDGSGKFKAGLHAPASLLVSPEMITLDHFRLDTDNAYLAIEKFVSDRNGIVTQGRFAHLQVDEVLRYLQTEPAIGGDLRLAGEWNLRYGDTLSGKVTVRRESGDAVMNGNASVALGLQTLEAAAGIDNGRVKLQLDAAGQQLGRIAVRLETAIGEGQRHAGLTLSPAAAIDGSITLDTPSLTWLGPMVSPALVTEGKLQSKIAIGGSIGRPKFSGNLSADGLHLLFADSGLDLRQGSLRAQFRDDQLLIQTLTFHNQGTLAITGPVTLSEQKIALNLSIKADHYKLLDRSDRKLVISGDSNVAWRDGNAVAKGKFRADAGFFDISASDVPSLSDDVVVSGREVKQATKTALALDLELSLGPGVKLSGRGLDALLTGDLKLYANAGEPLQARGTLSVASGTFKAYGRKLVIEQGLVRFDGSLANPALDILAMRRGQEVEAGVSVRGTVMTPRITLVSEPTVPDAEKLSWLILGRGLDNADSAQASQVQNAAGALLAQGAAAGLQAQIATAFGLDDFSVGANNDNLEQRIVTLGKNISAKLYVGYQQGLDNAGSALLLRYKLSKRVSLEAEAGTTSALMVFYNFMFD